MGDDREGQKPLGATLAKGLGPLEMEVLDVIWELGKATSREIFEKMRERRRLGQSTVLTVLRRLSDRGILHRDSGGDVYLYSPVMGRHELGSRMIDDVVQRVFGGSVEPVIAYLSTYAKPGPLQAIEMKEGRSALEKA